MSNFVHAKYDESGNTIFDPTFNTQQAMFSADGKSLVGVDGEKFYAGKRRGANAVIFGDSFTERNGLVPGRELDWGYFNWANYFLNRPFNLLLNAGVSGQRTDQILSRINTVIDKYPDWVFVLGGINDIINGISVDVIVSNLKTICQTLSDNSINVVLVSIAPNNQSAGNSTKVSLVNQAMKEWCATTTYGVIFADIYTPLVNATSTAGALLSGMSDDNLHLSAKGARVAGKAVADVIQPLLPTRNCLVSSASADYLIDATAKQLLSNPLMAGTTGTVSGSGASGSLATSWLGGTTSGTVTSVFLAGQARADGIGLNQRITVTSAGSGAIVNMRQSNLQTRFSAGDTIYSSASIKASGMTDVKAIYLQCQMTIDGVTKYLWAPEPSGSLLYDQTDLEINFVTPFLLIEGALVSAATFLIKVEFGTSGSGACVLEVGRAGFFKK